RRPRSRGARTRQRTGRRVQGTSRPREPPVRVDLRRLSRPSLGLACHRYPHFWDDERVHRDPPTTQPGDNPDFGAPDGTNYAPYPAPVTDPSAGVPQPAVDETYLGMPPASDPASGANHAAAEDALLAARSKLANAEARLSSAHDEAQQIISDAVEQGNLLAAN